VAGFTEIDFGDWEGLTREEIAARAPADYARWRAAVGEFTYPGGDAVPAFRGRVVAALRQVLAAAPERVLVVAHKGVIASVLQELLGLSPEARASWAIDLASIHVVESTAEGWRCTVANEVRHLEGAP
jgi:broad specificity phosphatase PhoE